MQTPSRQTSYRKNALLLGSILGIMFVFCLCFLLFFPKFKTTDGLTALVYQDGQLLHSIDLTAVSAPYELTVSGENGSYNLLEIRPGSIGIIDASCPDKLCVYMGFQESTLLPITCLPNNVVIRIVGDGENASQSGHSNTPWYNSSDAPLDGITY